MMINYAGTPPMEAVSITATHTVRDLLRNQPLSPAKVVFAWKFAAGPALARSASAEWSTDGTLRLRARGATWKREIDRAKPILADRLAFLLGVDVVRKIVVSEESNA
jgi:hypothetical protein